MKTSLLLFCTGILFVCSSMAQNRPAPFAEARKAIAHLESQQESIDSLRNIYKGRFTLDFTYGQRYILPYNQTDPDTITFTDFAARKSFYGIGLGYFINRVLFVQLGLDFQILPRNQVINSISFGGGGISGSGSGNGGIMINPHVGAQYYFKEWGKYTRPYAGLVLGAMNLKAAGGDINFSSAGGGVDQDGLGELSSRFGSAKVLFGFNTRPAPNLMLDFNVGYSHTSRGDPIGGIKSPGAISASFSMQFILNPRKETKQDLEK